MEATTSLDSATFEPPRGGPWTWWASCLWLPGCVGFGLLLAWAAHEIGKSFAPLVIFPLVVGFVLGASIVVLMGLCQMGHRPTAWLAVGLAGAAVVVGQHYFSYREAAAEANRSSATVERAQAAFGELVRSRLPPAPSGLIDYLRRQAAVGRPLGTILGEYTAKGAVAWLLWALDGLLVLGPAALMVGLAVRRPFCRQCGSFYAARRGGRLDSRTARRLAEELDLPLDGSAEGVRYRLLSCNQGCARTGFSLSCVKSPSAGTPEIVWLDNARRDRIIQILDESRTTETNSPTPDS
jgi:hypothetical protein